MPTLPRVVCRLSGQKNGHAYTVGLRADVGIGAYKNNVRLQRRGRCLHRPVGYVVRAGGKNGHACTVGFRADVGIGPYKKQRAFSA